MKRNAIATGSLLGAIGSSLVATAATSCCIGPAVIAVLGVSGVLAAARLAPYRPYFVLGSLVLLAFGFWLAYRPHGGNIGKTCATTTSAKLTRALLWVATAITVAALAEPCVGKKTPPVSNQALQI